MVDAFTGVFRVSGPTTSTALPMIALFEDGSPDSLNRVITLMSPYALWDPLTSDSSMIIRWAEAALAVPYTEAVGLSVVDTLLQIASMDSLQPHIPVSVWGLLKKLPSLPSFCMGRFLGTTECVVRRVRDLGDVEILKSYFLLVWSEWDISHSGGLPGVRASIWEDFSGIGMGRHREDLIKRLDHVLGQLEEGLGHSLQPQRIKREYKELKDTLLEVDEEATNILTRTPSGLTNLFDSLTPVGTHRVPLDIHLCAPTPVRIVACLQDSLLLPPTRFFDRPRVRLRHPTYSPLHYLRSIVVVRCYLTKLSTVATVFRRELNLAEMPNLGSCISRPRVRGSDLSIILALLTVLVTTVTGMIGTGLHASWVAFCRCLFVVQRFSDGYITMVYGDVPIVSNHLHASS